MLKDSRFWPPLLKFRENPDPKPEKGRWEGEGYPIMTYGGVGGEVER